MSGLPLLARTAAAGKSTAVIAREGSFTYEELTGAARRVAGRLLGGRNDLGEARVALLVPPGFR